MSSQRLIDLFFDIEKYFFRNISQKYYDLGNDNEVYISGVSNPYLNPIIQRKDCANIKFMLQDIKSIYKNHNLDWVWVIKKDLYTNELQEFFRNHSIGIVDEGVAMVKSLNDYKPITDQHKLTIIELENDLEDWGLPLLTAFDLTDLIINQYIEAHLRAIRNKTNMHHFVAYVDSIPVSAFTLSVLGKVARIDDLGTDPKHQKQGYASYLVQYALTIAKDLGLEHCFLESSKSGLSVYQRLGFDSLFNNYCLSVKT